MSKISSIVLRSFGRLYYLLLTNRSTISSKFHCHTFISCFCKFISKSEGTTSPSAYFFTFSILSYFS
ncbi:hypothetical protein CW304_31000 [Bacillus sp. UFRGS-B20]|nr:hypothetical protein CW304_31000 [Bacillus sp. UFRGS-B20]